MTHTKEPWRMKVRPEDRQDECFIDICGDIFIVAEVRGPQYDHCHPNARRIVACVNALAGIPTPELEAGIVGEMVEAMKGLLRLHEAHHNAPEHAAARALLARLGRAP